MLTTPRRPRTSCASRCRSYADLVAKSAEYLAGQYTADASSWGVIDPDRWSRFYQWLNDNNLVEKQLDVNAGYTTDYLEA